MRILRHALACALLLASALPAVAQSSPFGAKRFADKPEVASILEDEVGPSRHFARLRRQRRLFGDAEWGKGRLRYGR
jgi:hypothetical protein